MSNNISFGEQYKQGGKEETGFIKQHWPVTRLRSQTSPRFKPLTPGQVCDKGKTLTSMGFNILFYTLIHATTDILVMPTSISLTPRAYLASATEWQTLYPLQAQHNQTLALLPKSVPPPAFAILVKNTINLGSPFHQTSHPPTVAKPSLVSQTVHLLLSNPSALIQALLVIAQPKWPRGPPSASLYLILTLLARLVFPKHKSNHETTCLNLPRPPHPQELSGECYTQIP